MDIFWTFYLNHLSPLWGYFYLKLNKTKLWQRTKRFVYVTSVNKVNQSINQCLASYLTKSFLTIKKNPFKGFVIVFLLVMKYWSVAPTVYFLLICFLSLQVMQELFSSEEFVSVVCLESTSQETIIKVRLVP